MTLGQVGEYEGLSKQYLSRLELETNQPPAWDLIRRLALRYATTTDYLLGVSDDPTPPRALPATPDDAFPTNRTGVALLAIFNEMDEDQQETLLAVAHTLAGADERNRRRLMRSLVDNLFDDIAKADGYEQAEALMVAIDAADRLHDPSALLAWLRPRLAQAEESPDEG